jgi:large subunit ribosomal protein L22
MSAEDEKEDATPGDAPAEPAAKKPAAKKPAAKKPAAKAKQPTETETEQPTADAGQAEETAAVAAEESTAEAEAPAKKPAKARRTKKAAPAAGEQPAAEPVAEEAPAKEASAKEAPAKEAAPEPKQAAAKGKPAVRREVVHARARYVRTSARKARMVCGHIRGKSVQEARAILAFTPRDAARDWSKLLESAVANAENNHELLEDDLIVREAYADEGPTIKRFRPRAMGRATPIRKRTSHLTITLTLRS